MAGLVNVGRPDAKGLVNGKRKYAVWPELKLACALGAAGVTYDATRPQRFEPDTLLAGLGFARPSPSVDELVPLVRRAAVGRCAFGTSARYHGDLGSEAPTPVAFHGEGWVRETFLQRCRDEDAKRSAAATRSAKALVANSLGDALRNPADVGVPAWVDPVLTQGAVIDGDMRRARAKALVGAMAVGVDVERALRPFLAAACHELVGRADSDGCPGLAATARDVARTLETRGLIEGDALRGLRERCRSGASAVSGADYDGVANHPEAHGGAAAGLAAWAALDAAAATDAADRRRAVARFVEAYVWATPSPEVDGPSVQAFRSARRHRWDEAGAHLAKSLVAAVRVLGLSGTEDGRLPPHATGYRWLRLTDGRWRVDLPAYVSVAGDGGAVVTGAGPVSIRIEAGQTRDLLTGSSHRVAVRQAGARADREATLTWLEAITSPESDAG